MFALPAFNRRRLLLGLAAASVGAAVAPATFSSEPLAATENPALTILGDALPELTAEVAAADAAYWAIVREWEPRWPVAPDDLALRRYDERRLERGLRGWAIKADGTIDDAGGGSRQARCINGTRPDRIAPTRPRPKRTSACPGIRICSGELPPCALGPFGRRQCSSLSKPTMAKANIGRRSIAACATSRWRDSASNSSAGMLATRIAVTC